MMGTYRGKDICKGGEIYKKVMKILMEVLFFVFDNNALYLKKLILPKAIKADQKYNCCCEGTCFDICFCLEQRSKPELLERFAKWEA